MAFLNESIDFNRDERSGQILRIEKSASQHSPLLTDRNLRDAMQLDAKKLVERFKEIYAEC